MDLYTTRVRLGGSLEHEVVKHNVSAAEIILLAHIHDGPQGHPVCNDIVHTGSVNRTDAKERARLAQEYSTGELVEGRGVKMIQALFGVAGVPLPQTYEKPEVIAVEVFDDEAEAEPEVITPVAPIERSAKAKAAPKLKAAVGSEVLA